jgi:hypothetical protein
VDLEFNAPCPECGLDAKWSQGPTRFVMGAFGEYGMATETMVVECRACPADKRR